MQFTAVMDKIGARASSDVPKKQYNPLMASPRVLPDLSIQVETIDNDPVWRVFSFIQDHSKPSGVEIMLELTHSLMLETSQLRNSEVSYGR